MHHCTLKGLHFDFITSKQSILLVASSGFAQLRQTCKTLYGSVPVPILAIMSALVCRHPLLGNGQVCSVLENYNHGTLDLHVMRTFLISV